ncbi:hypothetical protein OV207_33910 [Corallococcus sp. BB11-1]|uniref:hypothetical protein n=1 Tax=Corallococcus sp. BB11-1 TaxID=2996783 RepID=UPI0022716D31|nr:hypothetical protein [Corallococcus sp. BB11-1]MCY1036482.1 hypothetical protein [Corallococcus sp. BB11-1]
MKASRLSLRWRRTRAAVLKDQGVAVEGGQDTEAARFALPPPVRVSGLDTSPRG